MGKLIYAERLSDFMESTWFRAMLFPEQQADDARIVLDKAVALINHEIDCGRLDAPAAAEVNADGLLPCPFPTCGSTDVSIIRCECDTALQAVSCNTCACSGPAHADKEEAIMAWNTRAAGGGG